MIIDPVTNYIYFVRTMGLLAFTGIMAKIQRDVTAFKEIYGDIETKIDNETGKFHFFITSTN